MMKPWRALLISALLLFPAVNATAQTVNGYMKVPNIPGDSTAQGHENDIRVLSVTQAFDLSVRTSSPCSVTLTKPLDMAGPLLFVAAVTGQNLGEVKIDLDASTGDGAANIYQIVLTNTRVLAIISTPQQLTENLTMKGDSISLAFKPQTGDGAPTVVGNATCR